MANQQNSIELLKTLIAFDTTSYKSNLSLIYFIRHLFEEHNIKVHLNINPENTKANLLASVGPIEKPGILLSAHTDVVPVEGQSWSSNPFEAVIRDGHVYGRGTADMKGFIACAVNIMLQAAQSANISRPLHLCLSYDEEIGCIGVRRILGQLSELIMQPEFCLIGEPTNMNIATGHKGKAVFRALCQGNEAHSSLAPLYPNAIHSASDLIQAIRQTQSDIATGTHVDEDYDVPYSTVHIGKIEGGKALNIVPNECLVDYEIRNLPEDSIDDIQSKIYQHLEESTFYKFINIQEINQYPGLNTSTTLQAVKFLQNLAGPNVELKKVSFGTEGGLFNQQLACPVLVCGPGSIEVAHKPNEYVSIEQIEACDIFLQKLLNSILI